VLYSRRGNIQRAFDGALPFGYCVGYWRLRGSFAQEET